MKKTIILIFASMLLLTGCNIDSLRTSKPLLDSGEEGYGAKVYISNKNDVEDNLEGIIILSHKMGHLNTLLEYATIMSEKVEEINNAGGGSAEVVSKGNATIALIQDLSDYITEASDDYDINYVYDELITIRDNMDSLGFLD